MLEQIRSDFLRFRDVWKRLGLRYVLRRSRDAIFTRTFARLRHPKEHAELLTLTTAEQRFTQIYEKNYWRSGESKSGTGSTVDAAQLFADEFAAFIETANISSIFDAPCGDWNWMRQFPLPRSVHYMGGDIVGSLIADLTSKYAAPNIDFRKFDITVDQFPEASVWLCRDCLFHLSFDDIASAFENFAKSPCEVALLTSHFQHFENRDITTGDFRFLNLSANPFDLPSPLHVLREQLLNEKRYIGLWSKSDLAGAAARYRATRVRPDTLSES